MSNIYDFLPNTTNPTRNSLDDLYSYKTFLLHPNLRKYNIDDFSKQKLFNFVNYSQTSDKLNLHKPSTLDSTYVPKDDVVYFPRNIYGKEPLAPSEYVNERDFDELFIYPEDRKDFDEKHQQWFSRQGGYFGYATGSTSGRNYAASDKCILQRYKNPYLRIL